MENIRLIATDMDGTLLLDAGKGIPPANAEALRAAHAAGIQLALCSGRIPDDMGFYAMDVGVPMHILALNGTCAMDRPLGSIIRSDYMSSESSRKLFSMLQQYPVAYGLFSDHDLVVGPITMSEGQLRIIFGENILREGTRTVIRDGGHGVEPLLQHGVNKLMIFTDGDPLPLQQLQQRIQEELPDVEVSSSWVNNLEVNARTANKGTALTALASRLGIPMNQVMAIGDNDNDVPMLQAAGVGVAMGNATPAAVAAAKYQTLSNADCGLAAAIRAIALGEKAPGVRRLA